MREPKVFGSHEPKTLAQLADVASRADRAALMADGHLGYVMPIGGVAAYRDRVSVVGVGLDIACGNCAIRTDRRLADFARPELEAVANEIASAVSFGIGRRNRSDDAPTDDPLFEDPAWEGVPSPFREDLRSKARAQLGTVGSGNHYVDVLADEEGRLWVGVHFGSRGLGHAVASGFLALSQGKGWRERAAEREVLLDVARPMGHDYLALMELAGRYAYAGREWVARKTVSILGGAGRDLVHNHHNYCLPASAFVPTPTGQRFMSSLRPGDLVYAPGGEETKVVRSWSSGSKSILRISTANRELRSSDDHPLLTLDVRLGRRPDRPSQPKRLGVLRWKKAKDVRPGDLLVCAESYYQRSHSIGIGRARLIGAFLGDGWTRQANVEKSGYSGIGGTGEAQVSQYAALCRAERPANRHESAKGAFGLSCSSKRVHATLGTWGISAPSQARRVPEFAFCLPQVEKLALLSGYFDADGSVSRNSKNHGRGAICSASQGLARDLRELAIGCGLRVTPVRKALLQTNFGTGVVYRCNLSADSVAELDLWHPRKRAAQRTTRHRRSQGLAAGKIGYASLPSGTFVQRVATVMADGQEEVFDLEVEHPSHAFVCEGVVVHNCWRESIGGEDFFVVRKGATPAFPGQRGFVGGSMGDDSVILRGSSDPASRELQERALFSTVHGAGRVMSRSEAAGKIKRGKRWTCGDRGCRLTVPAKAMSRGPGGELPRCPTCGSKMHLRESREIVRAGKVTPEMMVAWLAGRGVILRGGGLDESPHAYRRLLEVLEAQGSTIEIEHTLRPVVVVMAGAEEHDPYQD